MIKNEGFTICGENKPWTVLENIKCLTAVLKVESRLNCLIYTLVVGTQIVLLHITFFLTIKADIGDSAITLNRGPAPKFGLWWRREAVGSHFLPCGSTQGHFLFLQM